MMSVTHAGFSKWFVVTFAFFSKISVASADCGGTFTSDDGNISSPNFPNAYQSNQRCDYTITVPEGYQILLIFDEFQLELGDNCKYDYVEIFDGINEDHKSLGKFCGSSVPDDILSSGNSVMIVFRSDNSAEEKGFFVTFHKVTCGGRFQSENGIISSRDLSHDYVPNEKCIYIITVPKEYSVALSFQEFEMESRNNCDHDYVKIYDGKYFSSPSLGTFCGSAIPVPMKSSGNQLMIEFRLNSPTENKLFSVVFKKATCGGRFVSEGGTILSPGFPNKYPPNERCIYVIKAPEGKRVLLTFSDFELEEHEKCLHDYISIYDGNTGVASLGTFCGFGTPAGILSSTNTVTIDFHSDDSKERKGFHATFKSEILCSDKPCNHGGICTQDGSGGDFRCTCQDGYQGLVCEEKIMCVNSTCENGGTCTQDGLNGVFRCTCQHGYQGQRCEQMILCANDTCENGGICTQDGPSGVFKCSCQHGHHGVMCEQRILCDSTTCQNGGSCKEDGLHSTFRCTCRYGYKGVNCEERIPCEKDFCKNGGICIRDEVNEVFRCACVDGYQGATCDKRIQCEKDFCKNGGICIRDEVNEVFRCACVGGYHGATCDETSTSFPIFYVGIAGIGGILIGTIACILAIISIVITARRKSNREIQKKISQKLSILDQEHAYENGNENTYELM